MDNVNKTLYIPLYGKAYVSRQGLFTKDKKAEEIWDAEGFSLKGKAASKWLAYYMGMRATVFDRRVKQLLQEMPDAVVLHIGCGLDSRFLRVSDGRQIWYDIDFEAVIRERNRHYKESATYHMIAADIRDASFLKRMPENKRAIVIMEGVSMYLRAEELSVFVKNLCAHFSSLVLLTDCYSVFAAKISKCKNPIRTVGVSQVYGMDSPRVLENGTLAFVKEHDITPQDLIAQLPANERHIFKKLYAGKFAKKLYRMYEYKKEGFYE